MTQYREENFIEVQSDREEEQPEEDKKEDGGEQI